MAIDIARALVDKLSIHCICLLRAYEHCMRDWLEKARGIRRSCSRRCMRGKEEARGVGSFSRILPRSRESAQCLIPSGALPYALCSLGRWEFGAGARPAVIYNNNVHCC